MLDVATGKLLTEVGPGRPMGELLRRHWHPIAAITELEDKPVKAVRLLGEDLVLYRDLSGRYGLVARHCVHRRADLSYGFVEECGLRCNYHGWRFDHEGNCVERPYDDIAASQNSVRHRLRIAAYPVAATGGLLWAYLGPIPAPLVPNWEPFTWKNGFVQIVFSEVPCNWLQCQENSIDPVHFEWMHDNWSIRQRGQRGPYSPRHLRLAFEEFDYGFIYRRLREGFAESNPYWSVGRVCLWPHALFTGNHFEWRVPIDDGNTLSVGWFFDRVPRDREPYEQGAIPYWYSPIADEKTGRWITSHIMNQDFVAWVGQGRIADRSHEHLSHSDQGIVMMRRRLLQQVEAVANGSNELKGIIRDLEQNRCIALPVGSRDELANGLDRDAFEVADKRVRRQGRGDFAFLIGQPKAIRDAYRAAMGIGN
jgi:5,5'-dehydrodivanillate O-demethylase oxygenase subunit